jgi:hypothetical protein
MIETGGNRIDAAQALHTLDQNLSAVDRHLAPSPFDAVEHEATHVNRAPILSGEFAACTQHVLRVIFHEKKEIVSAELGVSPARSVLVPQIVQVPLRQVDPELRHGQSQLTHAQIPAPPYVNGRKAGLVSAALKAACRSFQLRRRQLCLRLWLFKLAHKIRARPPLGDRPHGRRCSPVPRVPGQRVAAVPAQHISLLDLLWCQVITGSSRGRLGIRCWPSGGRAAAARRPPGRYWWPPTSQGRSHRPARTLGQCGSFAGMGAEHPSSDQAPYLRRGCPARRQRSRGQATGWQRWRGGSMAAIG